MQSPIAVDKLHKAESEIAWRLLSIVNLVRLILASTLLVIFEFSGFNSPWGGVHPEYFRLGVVALLSGSIVMSYAILKQRPGQKLLAFAGSLLDSIIFA
ncbi:MAG: hypothetical protein KJO88_10600, partial [Gammaproteobacteria bacterium]|nr:hypothetical protein [Gammaproteobacteria bacterium]